MAPEQLRGEKVDPRTDQFSFCVALYEALSGRRPFAGDSLDALAKAIAGGAIAPGTTSSRVPGGVRRVLRRGLSNDPDARFASMTELLGAIERAVAAPRMWFGATAVCVVGVAALALSAKASSPVMLCRGAREALAPAWSDQRAASLARAFDASGSSRLRRGDGAM